MPRNGKRSNGRKQGFASNADVTLGDFANCGAGPGKARMKKAVTNILASKVKDITLQPTKSTTEDKDWFEKSLDEFVFDSAPEDEEDECYRDNNAGRRKKRSSSSKSGTDSGLDYPIDIWFILGEYIKPENVGRFACLCKSAYAVTQASKFWIRFYRRYYTPMENLPIRLTPECMGRQYALKSCVIRSLYYFYPLFMERLKNRKQVEPDTLIKRTCMTMWNQKGRMKFHYFFKLKESNDEDFQYRSHQPDLIEMLGDINANSEKRCKVLQVTSLTLALIPPNVLGQTLLLVSSVLSSDLRSHCMRFIFGPQHALQYSRKGKMNFSHIPEGAVGVAINSVVGVKVLDWWDPAYPHSNGFEKLCPNESSPLVDDDFF